MMSAHGDWHLQAQLEEDDQLSLGASLRRINPRPRHFCAPRCETRRCRKPVAISPELGQRIRDFPQQAFPLQREMKMFLGKRTPWSTGGHEAWAYEWPPCPASLRLCDLWQGSSLSSALFSLFANLYKICFQNNVTRKWDKKAEAFQKNLTILKNNETDLTTCHEVTCKIMINKISHCE